MALNILKQITKSRVQCNLNNSKRFYAGLWEPDYLEIGKPKYPIQPILNVKIKGHDYPVLESYQSFVHSIVNRFDFDVEDSWPFPPKIETVSRYKPGTSVPEAKFTLHTYERNVQISNVAAYLTPAFVRILEASLPQGVQLTVEVYDEERARKRFVPDKELLDLKAELEAGVEAKKKKKK